MGLWADIRACNACPLRSNMICQPISGFTAIKNPDVMFISESPGIDECLIEKPLQGLAGKLFDKMLAKAEINRNNLYCTHLVKCSKKTGVLNKTETLFCSVTWLQKEIDLIKPNIVFTLGILASKTLLKKKAINIADIVGQEFLVDNLLIIPMLHPNYLVRSSQKNVDKFVEILSKAKSKFPSLIW